MAFIAEQESIPGITQKRLELDDLAGRAQVVDKWSKLYVYASLA